jgi:hypothetical protein
MFEVLLSTLVPRMDIHHARTEAIQEYVIARMDVNQERMEASANAWRKETAACHEETGACLESKEPTSDEIESIAVHENVPKEEAAVESFGALKERYGDRHPAVGRRRQPKKRTQDDGGSRQKLAAARGRLTRRAVRAPRKGHGRQGPGKDNIV